jgi:hypothetical protein
MAVKTPTVVGQYGPPGVVLVKWTLSDGDEGQGYALPLEAEKAVAVYGTFGTGGTINWEGTLDNAPTNLSRSDETGKWVAVKDVQLNPIIHTAAAHDTCLDHVFRIAPRVTAGTGVTVDCFLLILRK